ncbi:MAG TPA: sigma factor [Verrucomicrobiae bacterium]|nr:sigma factor [Verrucomicrobiae bacterium]
MTDDTNWTGKGRGGALFTTTHWSLVINAGEVGSEQAHKAIAQLCQIYWYPLYAYVRRQGYDIHQAQDLTQEFFARLLAGKGFSGLDRQRGRFRAWLLASMEHFLAKEWRDAHRQKRGGGVSFLSLDAMEPEERYRLEPTDQLSADRIYERRWALTVLEIALQRLRDEFAAADKLELFETLRPTLTSIAQEGVYDRMAAQLNMTKATVTVAVSRLRKRYGEILREQVAQTVAEADDVDEELRHLRESLTK